MHDVVLAVIFAGMILVPCIIASTSSKTSDEEA
jgi:hypothetical protein